MSEATLASGLTMLDIGLLGLLLVSAILGLLRGITREVLGILGWVGAIFATLWLMPYLQPPLRTLVGNKLFGDVLAGIVVFITSFIILMSLSRAISDNVKHSVLGGIDRSLGMLFGFARGAFVAVLMFVAVNVIWKPAHRPAPILEARAYPYLLQGTALMAQALPKSLMPPSFYADKPTADGGAPSPAQALSGAAELDKMMKNLAQPKPQESVVPEKEGYRENIRRDMSRLFQNYDHYGDEDGGAPEGAPAHR